MIVYDDISAGLKILNRKDHKEPGKAADREADCSAAAPIPTPGISGRPRIPIISLRQGLVYMNRAMG